MRKDKQKYKTIVFIGSEGKETWKGTLKGLHDAHPFAKILQIEG